MEAAGGARAPAVSALTPSCSPASRMGTESQKGSSAEGRASVHLHIQLSSLVPPQPDFPLDQGGGLYVLPVPSDPLLRHSAFLLCISVMLC
jgi:hypothetical protein